MCAYVCFKASRPTRAQLHGPPAWRKSSAENPGRPNGSGVLLVSRLKQTKKGVKTDPFRHLELLVFEVMSEIASRRGSPKKVFLYKWWLSGFHAHLWESTGSPGNRAPWRRSECPNVTLNPSEWLPQTAPKRAGTGSCRVWTAEFCLNTPLRLCKVLEW